MSTKKTLSLDLEQAAALRRSELRYRRLFESAQDGILILNGKTGAITDVNPFLLDLLDYPAEEIIGRHLWEIGELEDVVANKEAFSLLQEMEYVRYHNLPLRARDGKTCQVEFVSNVYDVAGERVIQCNIRKISLRSDLEEETRDRGLEEASAGKAKSDVLAVLSHELRTPLAAISSMLDIMELNQEAAGKIKPPPPASLFDSPALALIRRNVRIGIRLLNELLDATFLEKGKLLLHLEQVDAHAALAEVRADFGAERTARQISIHTDLRARHYHINADPIKLHQILSNLIGNALKFTSRGGYIEIATTNPSDDEFDIVIRDNGIGMDEKELSNIFNPFVQGDPSIQRRFGGLGLGLSICRRLMEAHGGCISAHSAGINHGSIFTLRFPSTETAIPRPLPPFDGPPDSLCILLVEDHEDSRLCMSRLLQMRGHEVIDARNANEALQFGKSCTFDLLITDIGLPDFSGLSLLAKLKETQPDLAGIAISGYAMPLDALKSKDAGYLAHLSKPVALPKLDEAIRKVLQQLRRQVQRESL